MTKSSSCPLVMGLASHALTDDERAFLADARPFGVILFTRNLATPEQAFALCHDVRRILGRRAAIAIDQEGGRVDRLSALGLPMPSARALGRLGPAACRKAGALTGRMLLQLGINWDLAPCVDLGLHPHPVSGIGARAFARAADAIVPLAGGFLRGLESVGVAGCLKHFPGHGRARLDSHVDIPVIDASRASLRRDLAPYRALGRPSRPVMVAHCVYPSLDDTRRPATLSSQIISRVLRGELGHEGPVVADDIEMGAIRKHWGIEDGARQAYAAGNDLVLVCYTWDAILAVQRAAPRGPNPRLAAFARTLAAPAARFDARALARLARMRPA